MTRLSPILGVGLVCLLAMPACRKTDASVVYDAELQALIADLGLDGDPVDGRLIPAISDPLSQLGRDLFFSRSLGGNFTAACASCHHPNLGGGDALSLPIGVDAIDPLVLGPGRAHDPGATHFDGGPTVPRNSPTTFNLALWSDTLFWDGRIQTVPGGIATPDGTDLATPDPLAGASLASAQARFPVTSAEEMRSHAFEAGQDNTTLRDHLRARLGNFGVGTGEVAEDWLTRFRTVFSDPVAPADQVVTFEGVAEAIASYENSQVFVDSPWSRYVQGDEDAIGESARRGALLFLRQPAAGGFGCVSCHSGDFFTDEGFHAVGFPQIGRGKGDLNRLGGTDGDLGRARETGAFADRFAFRTPSLLNVEVTGPWGHAGAFTTLEDTVRYHLDPAAGFAAYDPGVLVPGMQLDGLLVNTQEALEHLLLMQVQGDSLLPRDLVFGEQQVADLVAFLRSLTDPRVKDPAEMEPWIPRAGGAFDDSQRLDAKRADQSAL